MLPGPGGVLPGRVGLADRVDRTGQADRVDQVGRAESLPVRETSGASDNGRYAFRTARW